MTAGDARVWRFRHDPDGWYQVRVGRLHFGWGYGWSLVALLACVTELYERLQLGPVDWSVAQLGAVCREIECDHCHGGV